ncbi:hypothetical protein L3Q82_010124 [Scortum barcoo]|uniref:Uncharacterized protein n=1 Tax=Scortum barcoo TaxID=214431 RepID=A0ACB8WBM2_9TELE|nr:hypothetical protein L3Q82_010124 [Scortum barcoo]
MFDQLTVGTQCVFAHIQTAELFLAPHPPQIWLKMSVDSNNSCVLLPSRDSRTSCIFQTADEKDEIPGGGEESVLEMLSYSKFSDLETWLCMPSSLLLPRTTSSSSSATSSSSHVSNHSSNSPPISSSSSRRSTCSEPGEADTPLRSSEGESTFLMPALEKEVPFLTTPLLPILSSTPAASALSCGTSAGDSTSHSGVNIRKRRRLAASPGGLHWTSAGKDGLNRASLVSFVQVRCRETSGHLIGLLCRGGTRQQVDELEAEPEEAAGVGEEPPPDRRGRGVVAWRPSVLEEDVSSCDKATGLDLTSLKQTQRVAGPGTSLRNSSYYCNEVITHTLSWQFAFVASDWDLYDSGVFGHKKLNWKYVFVVIIEVVEPGNHGPIRHQEKCVFLLDEMLIELLIEPTDQLCVT